ncbi:MAG: response regulator [Polaromonas sp.]
MSTVPCLIDVIEDELDIASVMADYLTQAGFRVRLAANGLQALAQARAEPPDLALLDIMLPGLDGLSLLRTLRQDSQDRGDLRLDFPVILLTARVEEVDRLLGLELGADDYICKPFSPREVVARVKAVLRRRHPPAAPARPATGLVLHPQAWRASLGGQPLGLTRSEFQILQTLSQQPGRVFSRRQLLEQCYPDALDTSERALDSHIKNLRRKITAVQATSSAPPHEWIRSVYGVGFSLEPQEG